MSYGLRLKLLGLDFTFAAGAAKVWKLLWIFPQVQGEVTRKKMGWSNSSRVISPQLAHLFSVIYRGPSYNPIHNDRPSWAHLKHDLFGEVSMDVFGKAGMAKT